MSTKSVDEDFISALTTTFTPPASCNDLTISSINTVYVETYIIFSSLTTKTVNGQNTIPVMYDYLLDSNCYPPGIGRPRSRGFWSPGICPSAWVSADHYVRDAETTVNCCPPGFTYYTSSRCRSTFTNNATRTAVLYVNNERFNIGPTAFSISSQPVYATPVQIRFRDVDSSLLASIAATSSSSSTQGGQGGPVIPPVPTPPTPPAPAAAALASGAGLSTGAKIGIGIGVPLGVIALGILAFLVFWRRRRAAHAAALNTADPDAAIGPTPYKADESGAPYKADETGAPYPELPAGVARGELAGDDARGELAGGDARGELAGSSPSPQQDYAGMAAAVAAAVAAGHYVPNKGASEIYTPKQELSRSEMGESSPPAAVQPVPQQQQGVHEVDGGFRGGPLQSPAELYPDHEEEGGRR